MLLSTIRFTFRRALENKTQSLIKLAGLTIGTSAFILIMQFVWFELSYDQFHKEANQVYRLRNDVYHGSNLAKRYANCPPALAPSIENDYAEVINSTRLLRCIRAVVSNPIADVHFRTDNIYFIDSSFNKLFSYPLLSGTLDKEFKRPNTLAVTEGFAQKLFGTSDVLGQNLRIRSRYFDFTAEVVAVLKDIPGNTHLEFDVLASMATYDQQPHIYGDLDSWDYHSFFSYIKLAPGVKSQQFEASIPKHLEKYEFKTEGKEYSVFHLEQLSDIHLSALKTESSANTRSRGSLYLVLIMGITILVIAWVNYININSATLLQQLKELGIRKVNGAGRRHLILYFITESLLFNLASLLFSILILNLYFPLFLRLIDQPMGLNFGHQVTLFFYLAGLILTSCIVSGLYPAWVVSKLQPAFSLRNSLHGLKQKGMAQRMMVIFQFTASTILIAGTLVVWKQVNYLRKKDLGINAEQLLIVRSPISSSEAEFTEHIKNFKTEMLNNPEILNVSGSYYIPGKEIRYKSNIHRADVSSFPQTFCINTGDEDLIETFGYRLIAGRNFAEQIASDRSAIILNETGLKALGYHSPDEIINQQVLDENNSPRQVIGVIADYHHLSAKHPIEPVCINYEKTQLNYYALRLQTNDIEKSMEKIRSSWKTFFPHDPFDYFFMDEYFNRQYKGDVQFGKVFALMAWLAIFIASIGLIGLALFTTRKRTKEIGVRKVLGSSVRLLWIELCSDFLKPILISIGIALPFAWILMMQWLKTYSYRTQMGVGFWVVPGLLVLAISIASISLHVFKAASRNPVEALRYE